MESYSLDTAGINLSDENTLGRENCDSDLLTNNEKKEKKSSGVTAVDRNREIDNVYERPTSLRLESVLEYTSKIKAFLGFEEEDTKQKLNLECEDTVAEVIEEKSLDNEREKTDENLPKSDNETDEKSFEPEYINSTPKNELIDSKETVYPLPDIIGLQVDLSGKAELENFPDILEASKNTSLEKLEITPEKFPDSTDKETTSTGHTIEEDSTSLKRITEDECLKGKTTRDEEKLLPESIIESTLSSITDSDVPLVSDVVGEHTCLDPLSSEPSTSKAIQKAVSPENDSFNEQRLKCQDGGSFSGEKTGNEESDSDDGAPYQIIYIEEGIKEVEKKLNSTLPQEPDKKEKENDVEQQNSKDNDEEVFLKRSRQDLKAIRRLSAEVVNSVLQSATDQVKVILLEQTPTMEENESLIINEVEMVENAEAILQLQDSDDEESSDGFKNEGFAEPRLSVIPEDKSLEDIAAQCFESTTSIEMVTVPERQSVDHIEVTDEINFDIFCGFGPFKPQWLQKYATPNVYVILYSIIGILHGSYYTYLVGVLTTLEKRFEFKSKTSGFIMMLDELTPLFLGVIVGHFGGRVHRPRLLSFGMFLSAFCCFASSLPYFLYGTATHLNVLSGVHNKTGVELCSGDERVEHCDADDRPPTVTAILLLMLGSFLKGFGNLAYYAIGLAYLDDNAKKRNTPLYFAVAFALRLLGPMVGFLMSSAFLKYYENPFESPGFGPDDPRWIGGWWMGFVLQGVLLLIFAGPMALFPRRLPGHRPLISEIEHDSKSIFDGLGTSLKRLARNPLYMLITLNGIFTIYGNFGYYIMLPKYMENQFRLSASSASLFAGPPGIASLMVSCIIGGFLIWKFKPSVKVLAGGLVILQLIDTVGYLILMIPKCERTHGMGQERLLLDDACNVDCQCSTISFAPVCGPDGTSSYFSPCYAGCSYQQNQSFHNCSCLKDIGENATVTMGLCDIESCWSQALAYIVTVPVLQFIVNILRVAFTMILLRSINPEDKNIALGVFETIISTVAFIPFPVLYGALVDSACLVWEKSCGETGNCWFYDIQKFNHLMHGVSALFCGLSTLTLTAIFFLVDRIKNLYKDEDDGTSPS